jgi:hypothetical protein
MAKTVVVAGDLLIQENIFVDDAMAACRAGANCSLDVQEEHGGAWRLADYIQMALEQPQNVDWTVSAPLPTAAAARAVALWSPCAPVQGEELEPKDRIWRIDRHLVLLC